ncbi:helix-turn-helix domain-containing protein [Nocardioides lianchengensis]|uniref:DNA binding domain-containing protein, excisionase family n=1 Tax=Nocardioides lianchengensis TaxID=1045774 RepID=A0A1G6YJP7_9ACTN|nr:helix-turn-helix domain-containing protein [Nocardioides lianchengensis]NYG09644.1 excisionase family DNA binding protein [Nocardioides lianchengensis]SDD89766.1 DNA binding domain-containing protein, excisionase family [Nocardioides lianchengensis]
MRKTATPPPPTRRLVGINQASEYADVHPITIRRWVAAGRVPAYRAGPRLLKIDLNELDAMLRPIPTAGCDA